MLQQLRNRANEEQGFTLIELLVVILIIGILAAIALPTFLGQKDKAKDSSAKSDVRNSVSQIESCLTDATTPSTCAAQAINGATASVTSDSEFYVNKRSESGQYFAIFKAGSGTLVRCKDTAAMTTACASNQW